MNEMTIRLDKNGAATVPGGQLLLGYEGNRGNYRLRIKQRGEWKGLTVCAHWHTPGASAATLVENGVLTVPAAVTAVPGTGCITFEGTDGSRTVTSADVRCKVCANSGTAEGALPATDTPAWEMLVGLLGSGGFSTPEEFGAAGDGVTDDAPALQKALESGRPVKLTKDLYLKSRVLVIDHDVVFDGDGHTLHCDGAALDFKENSDFLAIYSRTIKADGADCKIYRESTMHYGTYHRGYIEYRGHKPIPQEETYENYTVIGFMEHRAIVRNVHFSCRNFMGLVALNLRKMCHSLVDNVRAVCEDYEGSGSVGILLDSCCFCTIRNCYASGWDDDLSCKVTNRGYGICANGNGILVDGCESWDCKHSISVAGNRDYWSTDIRVANCTFGCNYIYTTRVDDSARFQQVMDSHAGGLGIRFDNCSIVIRNANESASAIAFYLTAPYVHISNLEVLCDGGGCWATVGGLTESVYLDNVHGDNLILQPNSMYERALEFHLHNCLFKRLQNSYNTPLRVYMTDCTITQLVDQVQWLKADGCYFGHDLSWPSHACISILGEAIFTGCTIYGHNEDTIPPTRSILEAPENSIQMQGCRVYIRRGKYPVFNTDQPEASYWIENIFGFRPGTENDVLDRNELY